MNAADPTMPAHDEPPALPPEILALMASFEPAASAEPDADDAAPAVPEAMGSDAAEAEAAFATGLGEPGADDAAPAPAPESLEEAAAPPMAPPMVPPGATPVPDADEATLLLAPVLGITAAAALHADLLARRGAPLAIEAGEVQRLGAQCLQLLLSAAATFRRDDVPLRFGATSEAFRRDLALLGFASPDALLHEAA